MGLGSDGVREASRGSPALLPHSPRLAAGSRRGRAWGQGQGLWAGSQGQGLAQGRALGEAVEEHDQRRVLGPFHHDPQRHVVVHLDEHERPVELVGRGAGGGASKLLLVLLLLREQVARDGGRAAGGAALHGALLVAFCPSPSLPRPSTSPIRAAGLRSPSARA